MIAALDPITDERGSPRKHDAPTGTPILQPTDERRHTGSHYTPRSLTEPIVRYALEPAFQRLGSDATPQQILGLKVCDPAMGSGAFLVEACRAIAAKLADAWVRWPNKKPMIPADEDEELHARRLVAQRCLYGVDKNPLATDLAKLSLWLATLARDHEFTFLDHALKSGDSLVGLTKAQIAATHWDASKPPTLVGKLVSDHLREAEVGRQDIRELAESEDEKALRRRLLAVEAKTDVARLIGDGVVANFFAEEKPKNRIERLVSFQKEVQNKLGRISWTGAVEPYRASLRQGPCPITSFHWEIEFPEVFAGDNGGFDVIVGNPPFAGKNTIAAGNRSNYGAWLQALHVDAHGNADLVAHFFRRAFALLRQGGVFGLIATNTIGQGDTRATGLTAILGAGGAVLRSTRRLKWPGEAAVVVSVVHVAKGLAVSPILDGRQVRRISAYLVEGDLDTSPAPLAANSGKAFQGSIILGMGFTFDDAAAAKGIASSLDDMRQLIKKNPHNAERIFPYLGGQEVNNSVEHAYNRYVLDFADMDERQARSGWPDLFEILEKYVKPARLKDKREAYRRYWWRFAERRVGLYSTIADQPRVQAILFTAPHLAVSILNSRAVFANTLNIIAFSTFGPFAVLQSRVHEAWARCFSSTLEDRLRYTPSDCFRTFPFPENFEREATLESVGAEYHAFRAHLLIDLNEGLTQTYNRFHARGESAPAIVGLRILHAKIDGAVLRAYGWNSLADRAVAEFIEQDADEGKMPKTRLDWPSDFRDEVLARLLTLNAERHAEEALLGIAPRMKGKTDVEEEDEEWEDT
jgi:N-6 DNA Methylase